MKQVVLRKSLAPNTVKLYMTGLRQYARFCNEIQTPLLPLRSSILENFAVRMSYFVRAKSINNYLAGVQLFAAINGDPTKIKDLVKLHYVIRGIKRSQGNWHKRAPKSPITTGQLNYILKYVNTRCNLHTGRMMTAAILTAFFGLLRVSEYTTNTATTFDPDTDLCVNDVTINFHMRIIAISLKASKTDPFREGINVKFSATNQPLCPFMAMVAFLSSRPAIQGPLFVFTNGRFLTQNHVASLLSACFPGVITISTHSLRRGGASALAAAGVPTYVIQIMG